MSGSSSEAPKAQRLLDKVALITGGASGLGEMAARLFVKHGAKVVIADIQDDLGYALCKEIGSEDTITYVHCNITKDSEVANAVDTAVAKYGKLDILFGNAGIETASAPRIDMLDVDDVKKMFDVNLFGAMVCAKHAARVMIPAKRGSILFTSSVLAVTYGLQTHAYTVSKHALVGFAKNLCVELGEFGIRVNCVSPSAVFTPLFCQVLGITDKEKAKELCNASIPLKEVVMEPEDVAEAALFLASDESRYITGHNLILDGGYSTTNPAFLEGLKKVRSS